MPLYQQRNRALYAWMVAFGTIAAGGLGIFYSITHPEGRKTHTAIRELQPGQPPPHECWFGIVRGPSQVWAALDLDLPDGGAAYGVGKSCYRVPEPCREGIDAGVEPVVHPLVQAADPDAGTAAVYDETVNICDVGGPLDLPGGIEYLKAEEWTRPYVAGEPVIEAWTADDPAAPWRCACAPAPSEENPCERLVDGSWERAPLGAEMGEGQWRGACKAHQCGSWLQAADYYPPECAVDECLGFSCGTSRSGRSCGECGSAQACVGHVCRDECLPEWQCGHGQWLLSSCGTCSQPVDNRTAGVCYAPVHCGEDHRCATTVIPCSDVGVEPSGG